MDQARILESIAEAWNRAGIRYAVTDGLEAYPALIGRRLHILLDDAQRLSALRLAERLFRSDDFGVAVISTTSVTRSIFAVRGELAVRLDLTTSLGWGSAEFAHDPADASRIGPFHVDPWASFAHRALLRILNAAPPLPPWVTETERPLVASKARTFFDAESVEILLSALESMDPERLRRIGGRLRRQLILQALLRPRRSLSRLFRRLAWTLGSLVGPDGAGKSTASRDLRLLMSDIFDGCELRIWRPGILPRLGSLFGRPDMTVHREGGLILPRRKGGRLGCIRLAYYGLDFVCGHFLKDLPSLRKLRPVLYDRCALDMVADPARYGLPSDKGARWLCRFLPKPDLIILLHEEAGRIHDRKPELPLEDIGRQLRTWLEMAGDEKLSAVITTDAPSGETAKQIRALITCKFLSRRMPPDLARRHLMDELNGILTDDERAVFVPDAAGRRDLAGEAGTPQTARRYARLEFADGRGFFVPLDSNRCAAAGLSLYEVQRWPARLAKLLLGAGLRLGLAQPFLRKTIVSRRGQPRADEEAAFVLDHLARVLGRTDLTMAISAGLPVGARKPTLRLLDLQGKTLAHVRIGWDERTRALVDGEAEILRMFSQHPPSSFEVPEIWHLGYWRGRKLCVQKTREETRGSPPSVLPESLLSAVKELASIHRCQHLLRESPFWTQIRSRLDRISNPYLRTTAARALRRLEKTHGQARFPFHLRHGDLTPWNSKITQGGRPLLYDWEFSSAESPCGWDIFHYIFQVLRLVERRTPSEIRRAVSNGGKMRRPIEDFMGSQGLGEDHIGPLFQLYLIDRFSAEAMSAEDGWPRCGCLALLLSDTYFSGMATGGD